MTSIRQRPDTVLRSVVAELGELRAHVRRIEQQFADSIAEAAPQNRGSARNLVHYLAVRQRDLRPLQRRLMPYGLSSLGRGEAHVQATLAATERAARALCGLPPEDDGHVAVGFDDGPRLLRERTDALFGPAAGRRATRIMVTLDAAAATDRHLVRALVHDGMAVARINTAHDDRAVWAAMARQVREGAERTGRRVRIAVDLAGPKLRTGPLQPGPRVLRLKPARDVRGTVVGPARCLLTTADTPMVTDVPAIPVPAQFLAELDPAEPIEFRDARGSHRSLRVIALGDGQAVAELRQTAYLETGTVLHNPAAGPARVGTLPPVEQFHLLRVGQQLTITRDCTPAPVGGPEPSIGCTLPAVFGRVRVGETVHLDDGRLSGIVVATGVDEFRIEITVAGRHGSRLRGGKGINLPDTALELPALSPTDLANLPFAVQHADIVELSFIRSAADVDQLVQALERLPAARTGIVVKIETVQGFADLPAVLLAAMRHPVVGVMIARGDLAVECGYERLAELQEEILWLCEAAHLPVIWATEVLDRLAHVGRPTRAEITDAAMAERAECVMLNKGPHLLDALHTLDDILARMTAHQDKKIALLRPLRTWRVGAG